PLHRDAPLHTLPDLLLPVIKHRQYVVATEQGRPVFFMSQAWLSPEAEARFLTQPAILMPQSDWNSGDRMWVCDWIAPFGHTPDMSRLVRQDIFPRLCWRSLYHRGQQTGLRVMNFRGAQVSHEEARQWRVQHPLAVDVPER
ncbi:toxin-activating lysine-acyltransferase, partial [Escherichia coli]|uniref:toxin-activating lysine-acyltransferase n=2 Tax=Enterobacteriaceae TaxID=543 RepID=UPI0010CC9BEA